MRYLAAVRRWLVAVLPLVAMFALGCLIAASGFAVWSVIEERSDLHRIAEANNALLEGERREDANREAVIADAVARISEEFRAMIAQHDENDHLRYITGHPKTPPPPTASISRPPRTTTATTRPRTTTTTRRTTATQRPAPTTTTCPTNPSGKCKEK